MDSFQTYPPTSLSASVQQTPHGVHQTKPLLLQVTDDHMEEILLNMENVLNMSNKNQAFSKSLCTHVSGLSGEK